MGFSIAVPWLTLLSAGMLTMKRQQWSRRVGGNTEGGEARECWKNEKGMMRKEKMIQRQRGMVSFNYVAKQCERAWERNKAGLRQRSDDEWCHGLKKYAVLHILQCLKLHFVWGEIHLIRLIECLNLNWNLLRLWRTGGLISVGLPMSNASYTLRTDKIS